jgi:ribulose-5-phosphate 4-epimerase/fuculose-1-phosphate aldolase
VFEIRDVAGMTDMLVRSLVLGRALAQTLGSKAAALMCGHGAVVVSSSLSGVVGRSIYMEINAKLQAQAIALGGSVTYLDPEEGRRADPGGYQRAWELWKRKAMEK